MRDYVNLLNVGMVRQLKKLKENEGKPGFDKIDFNWAYDRIVAETVELHTELYGRPLSEKVDYSAVADEAADIMNFAAMIILECERKLKK